MKKRKVKNINKRREKLHKYKSKKDKKTKEFENIKLLKAENEVVDGRMVDLALILCEYQNFV